MIACQADYTPTRPLEFPGDEPHVYFLPPLRQQHQEVWTDEDGRQRFRCLSCRKVTAEEREKPLGDMRLPLDRALLCLNLLCEGSSVRAIERITGTEKKTILRLLVQVGGWLREDADEDH